MPSVYEVVTARIIESLNNGVVPWRKPWNAAMPKNLVSGKEYRGVNVLLLQSAPFGSEWWLTYNQATDMGGFVKKGSRGCPVVFWKIYDQECRDGTLEKRFVLRYYTVFNAEQCQGIKVPAPMPRAAFDPIETCERIVHSYANAPSVHHGGNRASYTPALDRIDMPLRESFESSPEYYCCLFHELSHSTGASHRLARKGVVDPMRFADHGYAQEELCAEIGAAFLCAHAGIDNATLTNSAAYIQSWIRRLRSEPRWIVDAAAQASKAADFIMGELAAASETEATEEAA